jgi:hypothetical protein
MPKWIFAILILLFSQLSFSANKCCYCEIGDGPANEIGFFKLGCNMWLAKQNDCAFKQTVEQNYPYADISTNDLVCANGGTMNVGYVGHWSGSKETVTYLKKILLPAIRRHAMTINFDNTACKAMQDPNMVQSFIVRERLPNGTALNARGNQVDSIGLWEKVFGKSPNFWAIASTDHPNVQYPDCASFENMNCMQNVQLNEKAVCKSNSHGGKLRTLACTEVKTRIIGPNNRGYDIHYIWVAAKE